MTKWIRYRLEDSESLFPITRVISIDVVDYGEYQNLYVYLTDEAVLEYSSTPEEMGGLMFNLLEWLSSEKETVFSIPMD